MRAPEIRATDASLNLINSDIATTLSCSISAYPKPNCSQTAAVLWGLGLPLLLTITTPSVTHYHSLSHSLSRNEQRTSGGNLTKNDPTIEPNKEEKKEGLNKEGSLFLLFYHFRITLWFPVDSLLNNP